MSTVARLVRGTAGLGMMVVLTGCPGDFEGGYDKVPYREQGQLLMAAAPDPPPVVAGIGGAGPAEVPTLAAGAPAGVTQEMVAAGSDLFGTTCTACHGSAGAGSAAGPALADSEWIHISGTFDEIVTIIQNGVPNPAQFPAAMPPMGGGNFTPEQVREIGAYVFALSQTPA